MAHKGTDQAVTRREHDLDRVAKRTNLVDPFGGLITEGNFALRIVKDSGNSNITYIGKAQIGTGTDEDGWQIQKLNESSGKVFTWADGDDDFNNVWDSRETLSYS